VDDNNNYVALPWLASYNYLNSTDAGFALSNYNATLPLVIEVVRVGCGPVPPLNAPYPVYSSYLVVLLTMEHQAMM